MKRRYSEAITLAGVAVLLLSCSRPARACDPEKRPASGPHESVTAPMHPGAPYPANSPWDLLYPVDGLTDYNNQCTPSLTLDNRTIVYTYSAVNGPGIVDRGILLSTWNDAENRWDPPVSTGIQGTRPFITPLGDRIYYQNLDDIYYSDWTGTEWGPGVRLPVPVNSDSVDTEPSVSLNGRRLYFASNRAGGYGDSDIWVVRWNGSFWDSLMNLGPPVNTEQYEGWPRETADGQQLYFGSWNRDLYGWGDLWVSNRTGTGWGEPINLGSPINTEKTACSPFVTWDMQRFYCGSEANEGGHGEEDIWVAEPAGAGGPPPEPANLAISGWEETGDLQDAQFVYCLLEAFDGSIYAGTYPNGDVFRTTNGASEWTNTSELDQVDRVYSLLQASDSTIYAGTYPNGDVFKTTDKGQTWINTSDLPGATSVQCLMQAHDDAIYAGTAPGVDGWDGGGRVFKTTDGGGHWDLLPLVPQCESAVLSLYEARDSTIFAGGLHPQSIAWTTDGGESWQTSPIPHSGDIRSIIEDSYGTLWAAGWAHAKMGRVYRSTDGGASWDTTTVVRIGQHAASRHFAIVEARPGVLMTGIQTGPDSVVYETDDGGITWRSSGFLPDAREALCLLRTRDGTIYAGTTPYGDVFRMRPTRIDTDRRDREFTAPGGLEMPQNRPNPFNPETVIDYALPTGGRIRVAVYSLSGRRVRTLVDDRREAGRYSVRWDGTNEDGTPVPSGAYLCRMTFEGKETTRKLVLIK